MVNIKTSLFYQVTTYRMPQPVLDGARINSVNNKVVHPSFPFEVRAEWNETKKRGACISNGVKTASEDCSSTREARMSENHTSELRVSFKHRPASDPCTQKTDIDVDTFLLGKCLIKAHHPIFDLQMHFLTSSR